MLMPKLSLEVRVGTRELLESLVGGVSSGFQYRRCCLSILAQLYREGRGRPHTIPGPVSAEALDELLASVALLPQVGFDLRAPAGDFLVASDASNGAV